MIDIIVLVIIVCILLVYANKPKRGLVKKPKKVRDYTPPPLTEENHLIVYRYNKTQYLRSPEWEVKRQQILARASNQCELCQKVTNLQVHHIRYTNLFREPLSDLAALCNICHTAIHNKFGYPNSIADYDNFYGPIDRDCL